MANGSATTRPSTKSAFVGHRRAVRLATAARIRCSRSTRLGRKSPAHCSPRDIVYHHQQAFLPRNNKTDTRALCTRMTASRTPAVILCCCYCYYYSILLMIVSHAMYTRSRRLGYSYPRVAEHSPAYGNLIRRVATAARSKAHVPPCPLENLCLPPVKFLINSKV